MEDIGRLAHEADQDPFVRQTDSDSENSDAEDSSPDSIISWASTKQDPKDRASYLLVLLGDLPFNIDVETCRYITQRAQKLTGFNFSKWTDCADIYGLVECACELSFVEAERVVQQFYILHPNVKKHSIAGLTPALVQRASVVLSKNWERKELRLGWETFGPFFSTLALCDSTSTSDDEFRGMVRLAMAQSKKLALETTTLKDRMEAYILETVPVIKHVLEGYLLRVKADEKFKSQSSDMNLTHTGMTNHQAHTLTNKRNGDDMIAGRPQKKQRSWSECCKVPDPEFKDEPESSVYDSD
ncbi:hypothetical protein CkaCkLH20_03356 [Colletotrichum karsti]|uniref:Uncharacterized protein n=1 Tax=Colletotrichum karsti TaxID=1095194 RepID=A0A9P6IA52_9PEZI|nr:uncharacterized protein CkaCkLH20_03356 [Colletotrichum karsti]KAF9879123.1 hypothetical protein CkaCkLH20_03356 [Colletotrichum karsti]